MGDDSAIFRNRIAGQSTCVGSGFNGVHCFPFTRRVLLRDLDAHALTGATVGLANDHVLRDVDETTGQVTRLSGTKCGISQTLTSAVGSDEVLENRQALAVVRLNGLLDQLLLRVRHQTTHTSQLLNLRPVTTSTG